VDHSIRLADIDSLTTGDALQISAQIEKPGYLYCLWYQPSGRVELFGEERPEVLVDAIQEPGVGPQLPWATIGSDNAGEHLVLAFTRQTPLTAAECDLVKRARWQTEYNRLGTQPYVALFYPRDQSTTRGAEPTATLTDDRYLGELGTILRHNWGCYYQAIIFRVD
jgi:hypothetical protein